MKHRNHVIPCVIIALIAIAFLSTRGSISLGAGAGVALLLCPLVMGTMMWLLMRRPGGSAANSGHPQTSVLEAPRSTSQRPLDESNSPTALTNPSTWRQS
jgi:hypothetical protein